MKTIKNILITVFTLLFAQIAIANNTSNVVINDNEVSLTTTTVIDPCDAVASGNLDSDNDGISDICDLDDDNDGILDCDENGLSSATNLNSLFSIAGSASFVNSNEIELTPEALTQAGSAMSLGKIDFNSDFNFSIEINLGSNNYGADGIAVVFHNDPNGINSMGATGEGIGAKNIQNGIAIEFDTHKNDGDLFNDHTQIKNTSTWLGLTSMTDLGDIENGNWYLVDFNWDANSKTLSYSFNGNVIANYTDDLITNVFNGESRVHFGFTASTGGAINNQRIRLINDLCSYPLTQDTDNDNIPNQLDTDSDNDGCPDALEGGDAITASSVDVNGMLTGVVDPLTGVPNNVDINTGQANTTAVVTAEKITTTPSSTTAIVGDNSSVPVNASVIKTITFNSGTPDYTNNGTDSSATLTYKWFKNTDLNTVVSTTSTLDLNNVALTDAGDYTVVITGTNNSCSVEETVTLTVNEASFCVETSPTAPALDFNIFTLESLDLKTNETEGSIATGGDLTVLGSYQVAINNAGSFQVNNTPIGLLVGGKVIYQSGNSLQVNQNSYVKIGDNHGSTAWYKDQNNAYANIRVTPTSDYNSSPNILLQTDSNTLNVSATNNPIFESNLIDFANAFQTLQTNAISLSQNNNNAQLTDPNGNSISNSSLPNQVKINLQDGVNYLNVTGADLNNVSVFTYNNVPSATKILVINVDASGAFNWNVWNQAGVAQQNASYIIYNFYNTTTLNIQGNSTIEGTVLAPFADINKSVNQSNIEGQVIGKSFLHAGGQVHSANFAPTITSCSTATGATPAAEFTVNDDEQCFENNEFQFNNTSNTGITAQPANPITYAWNFGDGTTSALMNPTKTYTSSGTYTVTLIATNTFGSDTTTKQITVNNAISLPVITEATSGSGTVTREFTLDNDTNFDSFSWELVGVGANLLPNQKVVTFDFTTAGSYTLIVTGTKNGCSQSLTYSIVIASEEVTTGNNGGTESESLGDAISKIYVNRKKNSEPTIFVKSTKNVYSKTKLKKEQPYQGKGQTILDMFPSELIAGNVANVTSPTDILDFTVADEVLSVDFSVDGKTKGVVLGIKTSDKVYNHTKASCDRLRGAEILNIQTVQLDGYNFLMQGIKQRSGVIEYAISFAIAKNNNDTNYTIQTNWYVNEYIKYNDVYNFQVWSTNHKDTQKLVKDILSNLNEYIPVKQTEIQKVPKTFAAKISREKSDLIVLLRSIEKGLSTEISMEEIYSETANNLKHRYNAVNTELEQTLKINIADAYEYDGLITVDGKIQDAFYHADGNWGLDYDKKYTEITEYFVSNDFDREYNDDELAINRNIKIKAVSEYDYLGIYKSLLPGNIPADYTAYKYLSFTAKGSGLMELGLVKSSIEDWKAQYRIMVDLSEEEQTYYVPFDAFTSTGTSENITADDLTTITFTFLPVEANTKELDLTISDVKFTKIAVEEQTIAKIETFENNFMAYPNPSQGNVNVLLYSKADTNATVSLYDVTGKEIYTAPVQLTNGKNEITFNVKVKPGMLFLKVNSKQTDYGTSKIIFR